MYNNGIMDFSIKKLYYDTDDYSRFYFMTEVHILEENIERFCTYDADILLSITTKTILNMIPFRFEDILMKEAQFKLN